MEAHILVAKIHERFPKVPERCAKITGKSDEWYKSHHRVPKSRNPEASGNCSPVTHLIEYCHLYEAAAPGAGMMLIDLIHATLHAEYGAEGGDVQEVHKESSEAVQSELRGDPTQTRIQEHLDNIAASSRRIKALKSEQWPGQQVSTKTKDEVKAHLNGRVK